MECQTHGPQLCPPPHRTACLCGPLQSNMMLGLGFDLGPSGVQSNVVDSVLKAVAHEAAVPYKQHRCLCASADCISDWNNALKLGYDPRKLQYTEWLLRLLQKTHMCCTLTFFATSVCVRDIEGTV